MLTQMVLSKQKLGHFAWFAHLMQKESQRPPGALGPCTTWTPAISALSPTPLSLSLTFLLFLNPLRSTWTQGLCTYCSSHKHAYTLSPSPTRSCSSIILYGTFLTPSYGITPAPAFHLPLFFSLAQITIRQFAFIAKFVCSLQLSWRTPARQGFLSSA